MNVKELLMKASGIVLERGLARKNYVQVDGCVCTMGAVMVAMGIRTFPQLLEELKGDSERIGQWFGCLRALDALVAHEEDGVFSWNDAEGRTKEQVAELLLRAATCHPEEVV